MLPPGTYTFSVRAIDAFNNPHPMAASYTFTIEPAFTETLQFKLGLAIARNCLRIFPGRQIRSWHSLSRTLPQKA